MPIDAILEDPSLGAIFWDDFLTVLGDQTTTTPVTAQLINFQTPEAVYKYQSGPTTFGFLTNVATGAAAGPTQISEDIGAISISPLAAAHDNAAFEPGNITAVPMGRWGINSTAGKLPKLAFECKIQIDAADATQAMFVGLTTANQTATQNTMITVADALGTKTMLGFWTLATSAIVAGYNVNGQTAVAVGNTGTLVTSTYTKLGFLYDPTDSVNGVLKFYQDGVLLGRVMTLPASTAFPSGLSLTPLVYVQNAGAGAARRTLTIDWWRVGELIDQP